MFAKINLASASAILAFCSLATAAPQKRDTPAADEASLTTKLRLANSAIERYALLPEDKDWVFDFKTSPAPLANRETFPALVGSGGGLAYATFPGCSMAFVHLHPRSSELFIVTEGSLMTSMVTEAGVVDPATGAPRVIQTELSAGQMTHFPQGAFHTQVNPTCNNVTAVAAFTGDEDFGATAIAEQFFAYGDDILAASLGGQTTIGGKDFDAIRAVIPKGVMIRLEECVKKCGPQ
ncbi:spherulin [Microdochium trichocladiopsis]|uniref:Spherulin n=1 Tax=Microdochium trichocladiopsis TaxID=1682393 RepID=A0A9P9BRA8_9PEZI|nr:spherulin [Microdochium trichocladiopsis]KAH7026697.1 spherulin [Microdochium trichocladiopsis]